MTIAFITNTSWNIFNFRKGLVLHFISQGHRVIILAPKDRYTPQLSQWGVSFFETTLERTGTNPLKDLAYLKVLKAILKTESPNIILSFTIKCNIYGTLVAKNLSIPIICNISGLGTVFLVKGLVASLAMILYRYTFRYSTKVFFQNEEDRALFISKIPLRNENIDILPGSGINLEEFKVKPIRIVSPTKFLMISRVIIEKGVREYAEVAKRVGKEAQFTLVGQYDESHSRAIPKAEFDQWISEGIIQYFPHSDRIKDVISEHEVIVLPSYREGTPRTLLEGGAMGRPLIASNVAGCKQVVKDGFNGYLFNLTDPQSFYNKIRYYIKLSEEKKRELGKNSRQLIEEYYNEKIIIERYNNWIRQILD